MRISLPTGGVYAQALKDSCNACEEHYGNTDWVLEREELMPQEIESGLLASRRAEPAGLTPSSLPETIINLQNAPAAPDASGLDGILRAVGKSDSFRDMAGLEGTQENARAAMEAAAKLATDFGNMAAKQADANRAALERIENSSISEDKKEAASKPINKPEPTSESDFSIDDILDILDKADEEGQKVKVTKKKKGKDGTEEEGTVESEPVPEAKPTVPQLDGKLRVSLRIPDGYSYLTLNLLEIMDRLLTEQSEAGKAMYEGLKGITQETLSDEKKAAVVAAGIKKVAKKTPPGRILIILDLLSSEHTFSVFENLLALIYDLLHDFLFTAVSFGDGSISEGALIEQVALVRKEPGKDWSLLQESAGFNRIKHYIGGSIVPGEEPWGIAEVEETGLRILTHDPTDEDGNRANEAPEFSQATRSDAEASMTFKGRVGFFADLKSVFEHHQEKINRMIAEYLRNHILKLLGDALQQLEGSDEELADQVMGEILESIGISDSDDSFLNDLVDFASDFLGDQVDIDSVVDFLEEAAEQGSQQIITLILDWLRGLLGGGESLLEAIIQWLGDESVLEETIRESLIMMAGYDLAVLLRFDSHEKAWTAVLKGSTSVFPEFRITFEHQEGGEETIWVHPPDDQGLINNLFVENENRKQIPATNFKIK